MENTDKVPGVRYFRGRWRVRMLQNGRRLNLGTFHTKTEAVWCRWLEEVRRRFDNAFSSKSPAFRYLVTKRQIDTDGNPLVETPFPVS